MMKERSKEERKEEGRRKEEVEKGGNQGEK